MPHILFVCTANICRSPVAEVLFARWLKQHDVPGEWRVGSSGVWAVPGQPASTYSCDAVAEYGLDLAAHRSRRVGAELLQSADLVLCMTQSQCEALRTEFPEHAGRVHLLSAMVGVEDDISDPYGGPHPGYVQMVRQLKQLIEAGGPRIVALSQRRSA